MPPHGLVTLHSAHDFTTTLERLVAVLGEKGVTIFARIDHAAGASAVGLSLRPTTLLLFGNPKAGTPVMQAAQLAGIDLPLKALIWQDADGTVKVTYISPSWIASRYGITGEAAQVEGLTAAIDAFARHAAGP
jgi:uncharacterized protein (DUF302 family)